jgi:glycosyltransferase 2 family protein
MTKIFTNWKFFAGIIISLFFMYLSFHKVAFGKMLDAFSHSNFWYLVPAVIIFFLSVWLRAFRWKFLLEPIARVETKILFSSLTIGYMANTFLPAHLGEFLRAIILSKKRPVAVGSAFSTIVTERIIDVFTLLFLMAVAIIIFPFPAIVRKSGYVTFAAIVILLILLLLLKRYRTAGVAVLNKMARPLPHSIHSKMEQLINSFLDGIVGLKSWSHYLIVIVLSILIWACYAFIFQLAFYAFDFVHLYSLPWYAMLILLVITTISVLIPSSPGYVGTYHFLCQFSLSLFSVPKDPALSYAFVVHGINFLPVLILGLILFSAEEMSLRNIQPQAILNTTKEKV